MTIEEIIAAVQARLGVQVDGKAGPETWGAIYRRIVQPGPPVDDPAGGGSVDMPSVDPRSETCITTLLPEVRPMARALVQQAATMGIRIKVISGFRTYEEQAALYARGRTAPGNVVTNARPGYSNHNFGIAFDIGVFEGSSYLPESPKYNAVGALGIGLGLDWGGTWKSIVDAPHFQLRPAWATDMPEKQMLAELRARRETESPIYA